jgi:hypothetical protein
MAPNVLVSALIDRMSAPSDGKFPSQDCPGTVDPGCILSDLSIRRSVEKL